MLIGRKPFCKNCSRKLDINCDYRSYSCGAAWVAAQDAGHPDEPDDRFTHLKKNSRCPDKKYFIPAYTLEQVRKHNHHK